MGVIFVFAIIKGSVFAECPRSPNVSNLYARARAGSTTSNILYNDALKSQL
jgi:hypothetical protein